MSKILLFLFFALFSPIIRADMRHWDNWTLEEKTEYLLFTTVNYTDFRQAELCVSQKILPLCEEKNPLLGSSPNDATIAASFVLTQTAYYYLIGKSHESERYKQIRWVLLGAKITIVYANHYNGIHVSKVW